MEQVQFYISMTSVLDCLDHSNNTYKFLKWVAFPFDVKWSAVCLPGLSEQDHWHYSCYTIYLKESQSFSVQNLCAFVHDTAAVEMERKVLMSFKHKIIYKGPHSQLLSSKTSHHQTTNINLFLSFCQPSYSTAAVK